MALSDQSVLFQVKQVISEVLYYTDETGARQYIVTGSPQIVGKTIRVPISDSVSYGQIQGLTPAGLTLTEFHEDGVAYFETNESTEQVVENWKRT